MLKVYARTGILARATRLCVADEHGEIVAEFADANDLNAFLHAHHLKIGRRSSPSGLHVFDLVPIGDRGDVAGEDVPECGSTPPRRPARSSAKWLRRPA